MKRCRWIIKYFILPNLLVFCVLPVVDAATIDVEMRLNDAGFISYDHFKAELYLYNKGFMVPNASVFGILEIMGEYFFWPSFTTEVDFGVLDIETGKSILPFLEFDFPDIDSFIPFGPVVFWGACYVDVENWDYDYQKFWLGHTHKWTPTPTYTPTPTPTITPPCVAGDLFAVEPIVGNMRFVPAGTFTQGSPETEFCRNIREGPQFTHILTKDIVVMETEVSRFMWAELRVQQPTLPVDHSDESISPGPHYPVQKNTWYESALFANLLSLQNGFMQCYYIDEAFTTPVDATNYNLDDKIYCKFVADGYRLPTEGEWEYFARAGTSGPFSFDEPFYNKNNCYSATSEQLQTLEKYCVCHADQLNRAQHVGSKLPNPWNLKDVHGNVNEWCWDSAPYTYPERTIIDYSGMSVGPYRVYRGGSWYCYPAFCRSANRGYDEPTYRKSYVGLRLVRTIQKHEAPTATPTVEGTSTPTSTPTPRPLTPTPTPYPIDTPTPTPTQTPGNLFSTDPIVGNMMLIPAGIFTQGSPSMEPCRDATEGPLFMHYLTREIAVMQTEVTRQMWANLENVQPTLPLDRTDKQASPTNSHPVQRTTWYSAALFANLLSLENGFRQCYYKDAAFTVTVDATNYDIDDQIYWDFAADGYRLPTEAEWEYACRAGTTGPFVCIEINYNSINCISCSSGTHQTLEQYFVYCANTTGKKTEVVGSKLPNSWALFDMHGNVQEWCWDWYADYPSGTVIDYVGPTSGSERVVRGGGWKNPPRGCRSANRNHHHPSWGLIDLGFRLVRTVSS